MKHDDSYSPRWLVHPKHGRLVDVVAVPLEEIASKYTLAAANTLLSDDVGIREGDDVFILGFPKGISGQDDFPIWKRGSVATIPQMGHGSLPRFLVDTATREGMSGAPVILRPPESRYIWPNGRDAIPHTPQLDRFIGVYSGRFGASEFEAQLGIVWRAEVIEEIIDGQRLGNPDD